MNVKGAAEPSRHYDSRLRTENAALARRRVVRAAHGLFLEHGYGATTITGVAAAAGVSTQTVYNLIGGKAPLLKAAYDLAVAGDAEPVPIAERPLVRAMIAAPTARRALELYARLGREIGERTSRLLSVILAQAASGDSDVGSFAQTIEQERAVGTNATARLLAARFTLRPGVDESAAADTLWALTAPEISERLVRGRGWDWDRYERWLAGLFAAALLSDDQPHSDG